MLHNFTHSKPFTTEKGDKFSSFSLTYTAKGKLNPEKNNMIWIVPPLTADAEPENWWGRLVGKGKLYNPEKHFIICAAVLGSHYNDTNPLSENPQTRKPYLNDFPQLTVRDIVASLKLLQAHLGIEKIQTLIGGSLGGQIALEWSLSEPKTIERSVIIAADALQTPWAKALNETQRMALDADTSYRDRSLSGGVPGLKAARAIALLSYRTPGIYDTTQADVVSENGNYKAASYQRYQGEKIAARFNAHSYRVLTEIMDSHNIGYRRGSINKALENLQVKTLFVGAEGDLLFPPENIEKTAQAADKAEFTLLHGSYGHDGFLIEQEKLAALIHRFYQNSTVKRAYNTALIGLGSVGSGLVEILKQEKTQKLNLTGVAVKNPDKKRNSPQAPLSTDAEKLAGRPETELVIEAIDDDKAGYELIKRALNSGKKVVTANKKAVALHLEELLKLSRENNAVLRYEAAVCAAIPIIKTLDNHFLHDTVTGISGIFNGSSNYILTELKNSDKSFDEVLKTAQEKGYAESDPTLDIDGYDSLYKLSIAAYHAFGIYAHPDTILRAGIRNVTKRDIDFADKAGYKIKLTARGEFKNNKLFLSVLPEFVSKENALYAVDYATNAVEIKSKYAGAQLLTGEGAGPLPTATSVYSDALDAVNNRFYGKRESDKKPIYNETEKIKLYAVGNIPSEDFDILDEYEDRYLIETEAANLRRTIELLEKRGVFVCAIPQEEAFKLIARFSLMKHEKSKPAFMY